ncbi:MAG: DUF6777 domain-containing protein [Actinomycetes bacterium]
MAPSQDPNWHWDGSRWLRWDGSAWQPAGPADSTGLRIGQGKLIALLVVVALLLMCVGGGIVFLLTRGSSDQTSGDVVEIATEPLSSATDPFTPAGTVGTDVPVTAVQTGGAVAVKGGKAGLYGGTMNTTQCDKAKLVAFLEANSDKATAWAGVQGIPVSSIATFVSKLTSVLLRSDTLVINHGFSGGRATTFESVLQAGTAVLVNDVGLPVVKCYCGNPLTAPPSTLGPARYHGPTWPGWTPGHVTIIENNVTVITSITVINVVNNQPFSRPTGSDGGQDTPTTMPSVPPDVFPSESPTAPTASPTSGDAGAQTAIDMLASAGSACSARVGNSTMSALKSNPARFTVTAVPSGNTSGAYLVRVADKSDGYGYKFFVDTAARTITAGDEAAAGVIMECPQMRGTKVG